jgi:hypothetical protein
MLETGDVMFGFGILKIIGLCIISCTVTFGVGYFKGKWSTEEKFAEAKLQIETQLKTQNHAHLEYVKTIEGQLEEALKHAKNIPDTPCLDSSGVRVLNSIR